MSTVGNNNLRTHWVVLVASLVIGFKINFGEIIVYEIRIKATKPDTYTYSYALSHGFPIRFMFWC